MCRTLHFLVDSSEIFRTDWNHGSLFANHVQPTSTTKDLGIFF